MKKQAKNTDSSEEWEMASFQDQFITQDLGNPPSSRTENLVNTEHSFFLYYVGIYLVSVLTVYYLSREYF